MTFSDTEKVDIIEVEVPAEGDIQDIPEFKEEHLTTRRSRRRQRRMQERAEKGLKKNKYGWAFFLASMFIGLGITATFEAPLGLFVGLGIGFLFFVDPVYEKVMDWINNF